jgi:hypothetical protein
MSLFAPIFKKLKVNRTAQDEKTVTSNVLSEYCLCYSSYTRILQAYISNISSILDIYCSKCFMFETYNLEWNGESHMTRIHKRGTWIPACERDREQARAVPCMQEVVSTGSLHVHAHGNEAVWVVPSCASET